ncbi:hypothetical protein L1889_08495 [Paenalcaligenes niemegkensis]|uniref:hypothetical protein n=1 Tax=Paenalcaligenes niemegkensis TaxID=2895469 RepID=UPI001EE8630B|nr:hypothetical protein [Paenalcaligenes niemegkensis]MCQ9616747.1 hypothetical protein [Paenalcaligenes niemegkensis]
MRRFHLKRNSAVGFLCLALLLIQKDGAADSIDFELQAMQVRELLALEQRQLREQLGYSGEPHFQSTSLPPAPSENLPRLSAIYGVGKRLLAEFYLDGKTYLYLHDHDFPIGYKAGADVYRLIALSEQCVTLGREQYEFTQCLHAALN